MLVPPSVKPVVGFDPKSPLPKPTDGADVVAVAVEEPRVPKLSPPVELLQNKTVSNYFFKWKIQPPLISVSFPHHHCPDQSEHRRAGQSQSSLSPRRNPPPSLSFSYLAFTASMMLTPASVELVATCLIHPDKPTKNLPFSFLLFPLNYWKWRTNTRARPKMTNHQEHLFKATCKPSSIPLPRNINQSYFNSEAIST